MSIFLQRFKNILKRELSKKYVRYSLVFYTFVLVLSLIIIQVALLGSKKSEAYSIINSNGLWCRGSEEDIIPGFFDLQKGSCRVPTDNDDSLNFDLCKEGTIKGTVEFCDGLIDENGNCKGSKTTENFAAGEQRNCVALATQYGKSVSMNISCTSNKTNEEEVISNIACQKPVANLTSNIQETTASTSGFTNIPCSGRCESGSECNDAVGRNPSAGMMWSCYKNDSGDYRCKETPTNDTGKYPGSPSCYLNCSTGSWDYCGCNIDSCENKCKKANVGKTGTFTFTDICTNCRQEFTCSCALAGPSNTPTPTRVPTNTPTRIPTNTPTTRITQTPTTIPTITPTTNVSNTPTPTVIITNTPTISLTPTITPSITITPTIPISSEKKMVSGRAYCQDETGPEYVIDGARIYVYDSEGKTYVATTNADGEYSQFVELDYSNGSYYKDIGVLLNGFDPNNNQVIEATGQNYGSMTPPPALNNFALNCTSEATTQCVLNGRNGCGVASLGNSSSYANCGVVLERTYSKFDFRFRNCSRPYTPKPNPGIDVQKVVVNDADSSYVVGETVTFQIKITNIGQVALDKVEFKDEYNPDKLKYLSKILDAERNIDITSTFFSTGGSINEVTGVLYHPDLTLISGIGDTLEIGGQILLQLEFKTIDSAYQTCNEIFVWSENGLYDESLVCVAIKKELPVTDL